MSNEKERVKIENKSWNLYTPLQSETLADQRSLDGQINSNPLENQDIKEIMLIYWWINWYIEFIWDSIALYSLYWDQPNFEKKIILIN